MSMIILFLGLKWSEWSNWETRGGRRWRTRKEQHLSHNESGGETSHFHSAPRNSGVSLARNFQASGATGICRIKV